MRLRQRAATGGEVARDLLQRVLILRVRRDHLFDQPAPVELLAMRQHVVPQGLIMGTSKNGRRSAGTSDLPTNDSVLFSVRFCAVHPKDAGDYRLLLFFEVP
jgi:hypothetical protein